MESCPECDSKNIIHNAKAIDRGESNINLGFRVAVDENPDAFIFKQTAYSEVYVSICGGCGYIRFYAADLQTLLAADQKRQR